MRGIVRVEPVPMFRSCDLTVHAGLLDSTVSQIYPNYTLFGATDEAGLYVLGRGELSQRGEAIIRRVEYAGLPSPTDGCDQPDPDYLVLARGINPNWQIRITDTRIEVVPDSAPAFTFAPTAPRDSAGTVIYDATGIEGVDAHKLRLILRPGPCIEGRHAATAHRAEAILDGLVLTGCGWSGKLP